MTDLMGKKALLIDLSAIFWPKWHGSAGADINAAFRYTMTEVKRLSVGFDIVAACADTGRCFRYDVLPTYKANRPPRDQAAIGQYERVVSELSDVGYHVLKCAGFEADDVIATAADWLVSEGCACTIAAADKDLLQLVCGGVSWWSLTTGDVLDDDKVYTKTGVHPVQIVDYLSLVGDTADNIKGAVNIGPAKTAALLAQFGDIGAMYDRINEIQSESQKASLLEARESVMLNRTKLIPLVREVPIDCEVLRTKKEPTKREVSGWGASEPPKAPNAAPSQPSTNAQPSDRPAGKMVQFVEKPASTALVKSGEWDMALEPANLPDAWLLAGHLAASRLIPSISTPEAALAIILTGRELGIPAMAALRGIHIIEGKPSLSAQMLQALVLNSKKAKFFDIIESTNTRAVYETHRVGSARPMKLDYTIEDAQRQKLIKKDGNWEKIPRTMLRWRVVAELARAVYPDVTMGLYIPEELGIENDDPMLHAGATVVTVTPTATANGARKVIEATLEAPR